MTPADARPAPLSNRLIADVLGVSEKTVRNDARSRAPLPRQYVTGADGKQYPSTPARARWMSEDGTLGAVITPQERRRRAVGYRRGGWSLRRIAAVFGVSPEQVRRDLSRAENETAGTAQQARRDLSRADVSAGDTGEEAATVDPTIRTSAAAQVVQNVSDKSICQPTATL